MDSCEHFRKYSGPSREARAVSSASRDDSLTLKIRLSKQENENQKESPRVISWLFVSIFLLELLINYDSGAVPAVLSHIKDEFRMSYLELGILGGLPYVGLMISCVVLGHLLQRRGAQKRTVVAAIFLNAISCALLAASFDSALLYASRLLIGLTQAAVVIYAPVWVDEFAPPHKVSTWMGMIQAANVVGVMLGYLAAGYLSQIGLHWRWSIALQALCLVPLGLALVFVPAKHIQTHEGSSRVALPQEMESSMRASVWSQLMELARNRVYFWGVFALCALYFVVTGIQYWTTTFFLDFFGMPKDVVLGSFVGTAATAPTLGVLVGGWMIDRIGGYRTPSGLTKTLAMCSFFAFAAVVFGVFAGLISHFWTVLGLLWGVLFFGGATLPATTGILISVVSPNLRPFASAVSMFAYNLFGYALGSILPGVLMTTLGGIRNGMRALFAWSSLGLLGMIMAMLAARNISRKLEAAGDPRSSQAAPIQPTSV